MVDIQLKVFRKSLRSFVRELGMLNSSYYNSHLSPLQCHILIELESESLNATALSVILCVDKSSLSRTIKTLLNKGLIKGDSCESDYRQKIYSLTKKGFDMLTTIERDSDELLEPPLSLLSTEDCLSLENKINLLTDKLRGFRKLRDLGIRIRPIEKKDNIQMASIIRHSFKINKIDHYSGVSLNDPQLDNLSEYYSCPSRKYWVCSSGDKVLGGVGISKLDIKNENYCEMQKLYLEQSCLNMGIGRQLIEFALSKAKLDGYEYCYIETLPELKKAINIYKQLGFETIESAIVSTGHDSCSVRMIKDLKVES